MPSPNDEIERRASWPGSMNYQSPSPLYQTFKAFDLSQLQPQLTPKQRFDAILAELSATAKLVDDDHEKLRQIRATLLVNYRDGRAKDGIEIPNADELGTHQLMFEVLLAYSKQLANLKAELNQATRNRAEQNGAGTTDSTTGGV